MRSFLNSYFMTSQEGTALTVAAFSLFPILLIFALSLDLASSWALRDRFVYAAEAASTSASLEATRSGSSLFAAPTCGTGGSVWTAAQEALERELPTSFLGAQSPHLVSLSCLQADPSEFRVDVRVQAERNTLLIGLLDPSFSSLEISASSSVSAEPPRWCNEDSQPSCNPPPGITEECSAVPSSGAVCFQAGQACRLNEGTAEIPEYTNWLCSR